MSWSDQISKIGGQTVADGAIVGCEVTVGDGDGTAVATIVAFIVETRVGSADAVGSSSMIWIGAGLHA